MTKLMTAALLVTSMTLTPACSMAEEPETVSTSHAPAPFTSDKTAANGTAQDPLTKPIEVERAKLWLTPQPPEKLFGNTYLVGFGGLSVVLIDTGAGLVLLDGALPQAAPAILDNVSALGFSPRDIKFITSSEPHYDHSGGIAALARDTGATVLASAYGARGLQAGALLEDDPQLAYGGTWPQVDKVQVVQDREVIQLGNTAITAHLTAGHTLGSMSWSWQTCEAGVCKTIVFASSLNPVAAKGYRYTTPAGSPFLHAFESSYKRLDSMPCDILIAGHPDNAGQGRYNDTPGACQAYVERSRQALTTRLAKERSNNAQ